MFYGRYTKGVASLSEMVYKSHLPASTCVLCNLSKSFQKPTSEVRLIEAGFTDQTIAALYVLPFKLTKNIKLSMFPFKINHHILYTCDKLFKAKITDSDSCRV